jgi:hypothetical protein
MNRVRTTLAVLCGLNILWIFAIPARSQATFPPDFAIKSMSIEPEVPYGNSDIVVRLEVQNVGKQRVDNVQIVVNFSALFDGRSETASLAPGETRVLASRKYHPAPGTYEVKARLSLGGSAYGLEENMANNEKAVVVTVKEGREPGTNADLALGDVKIGVGRGGHYVEAVVRNIGKDPAKCAYSISLVMEVTKGTRQVMKREDVVIPANQAFGPGAKKKMGPIPIVDKDHPKSLEGGTYLIKLGVRNTAGTYLEETDTGNNYVQTKFAVGKSGDEPPPDFAIKSMTIKPAVPYANSDLRLRVEVQNAGKGRVDNAQIVVNFNALFEGLSETASLAPGETRLLMARKYHPAPGTYAVQARLGLGGSAYGLEENEANNEKAILIRVNEEREPGTNADLALEDVRIGPSRGKHRIEAVVRNIGSDPATCPFAVSLVTEVTRGTRQVMKREDVVLPAGQKLAPGGKKKMGPIPIVDEDRGGPLADGTYVVKLSVRNTTGSYMEELDSENNYHQGSYSVGAKRVTKVPVGKVVAPKLKVPVDKSAALKVPAGRLRLDHFTASPDEVRVGAEVTLGWSLPDASEAALSIGDRVVALELPAGEMRVVPSCDLTSAPFCHAAYRIVGKTKDGREFEREVRIRVNKR